MEKVVYEFWVQTGLNPVSCPWFPDSRQSRMCNLLAPVASTASLQSKSKSNAPFFMSDSHEIYSFHNDFKKYNNKRKIRRWCITIFIINKWSHEFYVIKHSHSASLRAFWLAEMHLATYFSPNFGEILVRTVAHGILKNNNFYSW